VVNDGDAGPTPRTHTPADTGCLNTDGGGYVSNVAVPEYLKVARLAFLPDRLGERFDDVDFVLASLTRDDRSGGP